MASSDFFDKQVKMDIMGNDLHSGLLLFEKDLALTPMLLDDKLNNEKTPCSGVTPFNPNEKCYNSSMFICSSMSEVNEISELLNNYP